MKYADLPSYWSNNKRTMSYSRLSTLLECPLRHYFQYGLGMFVDKDTPAINLGICIHKILEKFHALEPMKSKKEAINYLRKELDKIWKETKDSNLAVADKRTSYEANLELGKMLLDEYMNSFSRFKIKSFNIMQYKYADMNNPIPATELPFKIPIINLLTGEVLVHNYNLTGIIDLLVLIDNIPHVLDHKVLSIKPKPFLLENDLQLAIYAYVLLFLASKNVIYINNNTLFTIPELTNQTKIDVGFNHMLKPYNGPDWSNKRKEPKFERNIRQISVEEINGVLRIIANAIYGLEACYERAMPRYGDHCTWKCELTEPCRAFRFMKDPIVAFEQQYGKRPEHNTAGSNLLKEELF